ncbi:retrovirus-related pol polyprotein from transposon TNT 1-94 [Tanacetum coccineum]
MGESMNKFMAESAKRHDKNSILIKEIRSSTYAAIQNQGASIKALEIQIRHMSKVLQERGSVSLPGSNKTNPRDHVKSISTTIETDTTSIRRIGQPEQNADIQAKSIDYSLSKMEDQVRRSMNKDPLPQKEKDPGSFTLPCYINNVCFEKALADLGASVSVMPLTTFTNLGLGDLTPTKLTVELADRTIKCPKGVAENVLVEISKFVFPIDFIVLDMPEDVKVSLILGRPFLSTAHAKIDVFEKEITLRVWNEKVTFKSIKPTSSLIKRVYVLSLRERMKLDLEARLMGEALMINRSQDPSFEDFIKLNNINTSVELRRNQVKDLGLTIGDGEVINKPITDIIKTRNNESFEEYPIVENMDGYRDQDMGDVIFGEPFCKASYVEARRFDGLITIYNGNGNVTYQMARSHLRFKHLSNAQCNKIRPLLKELTEKCNVISDMLILWNYCVHAVRARIQTLLHTQSCS